MSGKIDLLLADVVMPLMDGRELAQRMVELHPGMKVMLMSGSHEVGTVETAWAFIEKPLAPRGSESRRCLSVADYVGEPAATGAARAARAYSY